MNDDLRDAIQLLQRLVAPCDGGTGDHAWRKCRRCAAVHGVEMHFELSLRLLQTAIDALNWTATHICICGRGWMWGKTCPLHPAQPVTTSISESQRHEDDEAQSVDSSTD